MKSGVKTSEFGSSVGVTGILVVVFERSDDWRVHVAAVVAVSIVWAAYAWSRGTAKAANGTKEAA